MLQSYTPPVLLWFKRDLRVADHPALTAAGSYILPVYIIEPEYWALPDTSARQWMFTAEALESLRHELARLGQPLIIRKGDAVQELSRLCSQNGITRMLSHEETGNGWTFARDKRVAAWAAASGVIWEELPQCGVIRRLPTRDKWQRLRNGFMRQPLVDPPAKLAPLAKSVSSLERLPDARALSMAPDSCAHRQEGSHRAAALALETFLGSRGARYRMAMSSPVSAERACSRLSPYLAAGVLSVRQVEQARSAARDAHDGRAEWQASLNSFAKRLAWRDHFIQKLEDAPSLEYRCLHPAHEDLRPRMSDRSRLHAWAMGETGVPFVDACMRYLRATGWLNFRMRAMLMSFASYHLWLDWRSTGPILARLFTDYEPGIHWSQVQMQSGTTGINTIRIYNPVKQGFDQDSSGKFIRRWVPELSAVPLSHLHTPWTWTEGCSQLQSRYPMPIVDLAQAGAHARDTIWRLRKQDGFQSVARAVADKHASRARHSDRSSAQSIRAARRKRVHPDQLTLDL